MFGRIKKIFNDNEKKLFADYYKRYFKNSFINQNCKTEKQYEASITRFYHTIEKGLSFLNYRPGFGHDTILVLINEMEKYASNYDTEKFFYKTALSTLFEYIKKNKQYGFVDTDLENRIKALPGKKNNKGGSFTYFPTLNPSKSNYEQMIKNRHSMRHFSKKQLDIKKVEKAIALAQYTPSACNRQGWHTIVIKNKEIMEKVLENQNGNSGFGQEFNMLLLVVGDLQYFNRDREIFQVYIDSGMYSMRLLDCLNYYGIATCPLSASLYSYQENNIRNILNLNESEILIMFVGIGNYPNQCQTTKSERHEPYTKIY